MASKTININLKIWRQKNANSKGSMETYKLDNVSTDSSFLEMLEIFSPPDFQGPLNTHKRFQRAKSLSFAISQSQKNFIPGSIQIIVCLHREISKEFGLQTIYRIFI
jgi:hypothetical protein